MIFEDKLQAFPATPPNLFVMQLVMRAPPRGVKLLFYMEKEWRG